MLAKPAPVDPAFFARANRAIVENDDLTPEAPLPDVPTAAMPGTDGKILVMAERVGPIDPETEEPIAPRCPFHPDDLKLNEGRRLLRLGFRCSQAGNGEFVWLQPVDEKRRRQEILATQEAEKKARAEARTEARAQAHAQAQQKVG